MTTTLKCPGQTKGWDVRDSDLRRYYISPEGKVYREMRQVTDGPFRGKPDVIIRYTAKIFRPGQVRWLKELGPRQAKEALASVGLA